MNDVDFSGASLTDSMTGSSLLSVDFSRSRLTRVNFSKADIRGANFTDVVLSEVNFAEAEWWLAKGWSNGQLDQLEQTFPHVSFANGEQYLVEIKAKQQVIKSARDDRSAAIPGSAVGDPEGADKLLARALNELAWYRATHGADLPIALIEVDEALTIVPDLDYVDTKAYILMQQGNFVEAKQLFLKSLPLDVNNPSMTALSGKSTSIVYRCARALEAMGDDAAAKMAYGYAAGNYEPTHGRVLLKKPDRSKPP